MRNAHDASSSTHLLTKLQELVSGNTIGKKILLKRNKYHNGFGNQKKIGWEKKEMQINGKAYFPSS